jgi:hypothetical protein
MVVCRDFYIFVEGRVEHGESRVFCVELEDIFKG